MEKIVNFLKKHKLLTATLLIALAIFAGRKLLSRGSETKKEEQTITAKVGKGNVTSSISASGKVATANYLSVTTSVNGIVREVFVKEGDDVETGQKIMELTLDSEGERSRISSYNTYLQTLHSLHTAEKSLVTLEANVFKEEEDFEDVQETTSYQTSAERVAFKTAEAEHLTAKNNLELKKEEIQRLKVSLSGAWLDYQLQSPVITAPTNGVIASVLAVDGAKIENSVSERSTQTVAAIKKPGAPIATLNVGEIDINNVKVGQKVNLTLNSISGKVLVGAVAGIDKIGTSESGVSNYPVTVKFDKESDLVLPNMTVTAEIVKDEKQGVLYVPTASIQVRRGKSTVNVMRNGQREEVEVQTGISDADNTEIISGLSEGEEVVVNTLPTEGFTSGQNQGQFRGGGGFRGF
ncbi:hypothetical protein A2716_04370 [candidate division WWE3 bacterium RIFCSPHIGHO2_01_FULL_40_23]|uniref:Uncharacterized protein n=1 Tax=candidate division WWE3 bacterium RIFCSPLOWO2_01_FULL_41_18 TaxID=1802625 RepID=A0A1F4VD85_UNCKA|nr:MAG: hypothetical protein A2716_04370 [candidate division WWE3 bacterium RIFCSPHIGHO2_01_FULL_40_23]OGC55109.1 MAG: hypothetical protein A3A78_03980 [candidate division WWE3 bacterium RIFCSPLOWO2_01_FULL_41_18]